MNHSSYFICADVIIFIDEYVIDFLYVCEWRPTSGGQGTPTCTWWFASIVGVYASFFCLSAWLSRNSSSTTCCCYYCCLCSLLNMCVRVCWARTKKKSFVDCVCVDKSRESEREKKRKRLTLYSSHRKISTKKNVNLIYVLESPRKKYTQQEFLSLDANNYWY
jgi:hypothetical protein